MIAGNEQSWRRWLSEPELEQYPPPELQATLASAAEATFVLRLMLIRCVRSDRFYAGAVACIKAMQSIAVPERAGPLTTGVFLYLFC